MRLIAAVAIGVVLIFGAVFLWPEVETNIPPDEVNQKRSERSEETAAATTGQMVEVYNGIRVSVNSKTLDVSDRGLTGSLKAEIRQLSSLRELDMSDNDLTGIPAEIGQLSQLEVLDLSNNPFTGLPYELGNLSNLERLDLRGTNYAEADLEIIRQSLPVSVEVITVDPTVEEEVFEIQGRQESE